ncbi:MAG: hypothetical protein JNL08_07310 [Planctomycetes bacterium]|nr:hypothetical protein [Planctomycetota bacterium]
MTRTFLLAATAALAAAPVARAQLTLALDGQTAVVRPLGGSTTATVVGTPGMPVALMVDVSPGPVNVLGLTVPLGLTPAFGMTVVGFLPPGGSLDVVIDVPYVEVLHATTTYFAALSLDSGAPSGLAVSNGVSLTNVARPQLAGNPLASYPFFEHVSAINRQAPVSLAIDPRFAFLGGETADIYVTAKRTAAQWDANPTLADVRGAPQTVLFAAGATTIQQYTFQLDAGTLPGPNEAPSSGDARIGVGYDVVVDLDQDGQLDLGSDLIDGYGDEAGFYVVRNLALGGIKTVTTRGPYPVSTLLYSGGSFLGQKTYYPSNIATLGQLPLVVVSHGNGHDYQWYDHIGFHLASYGYVVMSHQNNTVPGSHTAAQSTLANTDYILANQATIGGGVLNGRIDDHKIVWIGHSRGADGVARAYDLLFNGGATPAQFTRADIVLVSSMAPVDFGGFDGSAPLLGGTGNGSHPHDANFHLWVAQADSDVNGCASDAQVFWYALHERATRQRQSISIYGAGHGDLHDGTGGAFASGPNLIGRTTTHDVMRGYLLALVSHWVQGDVPSRDFLWRQYETFRAVGAPTTAGVVVNMMLKDDPQSAKYVIDDFQNQATAAPGVATCGATVTVGVQSFVEGRLDDANSDFTHAVDDPFNGFTFDSTLLNASFRSNSYGCVFQFDGAGTYELVYDLATASARPDFSDFTHLSFRAAQGTRHPLTTVALGDLTFSVRLEDESGNQGTVNIGAYGGGIEEPYQRNSGPACGTGNGWNSEFETIRIRLTDFQNNGSGVQLARVRKIAFRFGTGAGSAQGRLALDEVELVNN